MAKATFWRAFRADESPQRIGQGTSAGRLAVMISLDRPMQQHHHKPRYHEIVHRAHLFGLAGASVLRGIEGYGASSRVHTARLLSLSEDLPIVIVIVDSEERIRAFLPQLDELVTEGLVIIDPVEVIRYIGRPAPDAT
jgi:uncharacterized protein